MAAPTPGSFLNFFRAVFKGSAGGAGNILVSAGQALARLGARLQRVGAPGPKGFQPKAPTVRPVSVPISPGQKLATPSAMPFGKGKPTDTIAYEDGKFMKVASSWIDSIEYRPKSGVISDEIHMAIIRAATKQGGIRNAGRQYMNDKGFLTMKVRRTMKSYTYPNVPRGVFNDMLRAPRAGLFYWHGWGGSPALLTYSNRAYMRFKSKSRLTSYKGFRNVKKGYRPRTYMPGGRSQTARNVYGFKGSQ